jgi:phage terminase large subunit
MKANDITKRDIGYADSADPKSIVDINRYGYTLKPVKKGADSIMYGVGIMQENAFMITKRSVNLRKELQNYCWAKDKDGNEINKPIDNWNHGLDAIRYLEMELKLNKRGKRRVRSFG